jgi:hypothetical protein
MEKGCRPVLKVQFFPGLSNKDSMLFNKAPPLPVGENPNQEITRSVLNRFQDCNSGI